MEKIGLTAKRTNVECYAPVFRRIYEYLKKADKDIYIEKHIAKIIGLKNWVKLVQYYHGLPFKYVKDAFFEKQRMGKKDKMTWKRPVHEVAIISGTVKDSNIKMNQLVEKNTSNTSSNTITNKKSDKHKMVLSYYKKRYKET